MASGKAGVHVVRLKPIVVPEKLQQGCPFIKWDDDSTIGTHVTLCIDSKGFFLYWKDASNDIEFLEISSIRDTRTGRSARVPQNGRLRESCNIGPPEVPLEEKTFTVSYAPDFVNTSFINFVASKPEQALEWTLAVKDMAYNLLALNSSPYTLLAKAHTKIQLMVDREARIPVKNVIKLFASDKHDKKRVEQALDFIKIPTAKSSYFDPEELPLETFLQFYKHLVVRDEVDKIFDRIISGGDSNKKVDDHSRLMTVDQFVDFLNKEQRDPRLNEILYQHADRAKGVELISQYEPNKANIEKECISADGFLRYLMSDDNAIVAPEKFDQNQDMNQPLNHYFINSSHNTYLTGHQFTGKSSVEIYRQCLLAGCRCIELDCWNGRGVYAEEPIITHGYTVVNEIPCKDVLEAIAETAFKTSEYPVILSFENHCSGRQQKKIASYCRQFFGDMLLTEPLPSHPLEPGVSLPSPNQLKRKILIKNKKKQMKTKPDPNLTTNTSTSSNTVTPTSSDLASGIAVTSATSTATSRTETTLSTVSSPVDSLTTATVISGLPSSTSERQATLQPHNSDESASIDKDDSSQIADSDNCLSGQGGLTVATATGTSSTVNNTKPATSCDMEDVESDSDIDDDETGPTSEAGVVTSSDTPGGPIDGTIKRAEAEACDDMSALVNYIQPVNFESFEHSEKRNRSYEISSFVETQATGLLKDRPVDFVNLNKVQLSRIYPRGTRVDSSNYMPQVFWNAGCQMVALNFQTLDLGMQLNLGIFEYNARTGYLLKPDFMRRLDRKFDPFTESTVDGIIAGTVSVKIISGQFLCDKRTGTYVEVDMFGLPADTHRRKRTKTVPNNGINPIYDDEPFIFKKVVLPDLASLRISAYEEGGKFIGHRILSVVGLRPGYRHLALRNESNQPLTLPTLFVHITVRDYVPEVLLQLADALANPIAYQSMSEKRALQLQALTDENDENPSGEGSDGGSTEKGISPGSGSQGGSAAVTKVIGDPTSDRKSNLMDDGRRISSGLIGSSASTISKTIEFNMNGNVSVSGGRISSSSASANSSALTSLSQSASSPAHPSSTSVPPLIRQDTISMRKNQSVRSLSDETGPEKVVYLLESEAVNLEAESLETIKSCAEMVKVKNNLEKKLEQYLTEERKNFEKLKSKEKGNPKDPKRCKLISFTQNIIRLVLGLTRKSSSSSDARSLKKRSSEAEVSTSSLRNTEKLKDNDCIRAETLYNLTLVRYEAEKQLQEKYHEKYYSDLEKAMQSSQSAQKQFLQKAYETDVSNLMRRVDAQSKKEIVNLGKKYKDKAECSRVKREQQQRIIESTVIERQRLDSLWNRKKSELASKHEVIQRELIEDKRRAKERLEREFQQKVESLNSISSSSSTSTLDNQAHLRQQLPTS